MIADLLCYLLLNHPTADTDAGSMVTCLEVAQAAQSTQIPPSLLVSLAWYESRLNTAAVSRRGAVGALQVMPMWLKGRTPIESGAAALVWWRTRANGWRQAVAMYNAGHKPGRHAYRFADRVLALAEALRVEVGP